MWRVVDRAQVAPDGEGIASAQTLRRLLGSHRFVGRRCVVGVPRAETLMQAVRLPRLKDSEMKQAVVWEAAERFNRSRDELEVDCIRMGEVQRGTETRDEVLIVAAARDRLQRRLDALIEAGLRPVAVDLGVCALVRAHSLQCRREADQHHVRALLEVGAGGSTFLVLRGDQIAMCKPIEIGGVHLDQAVATRLGLDLAAARMLRVRRLLRRVRAGTGPTREVHTQCDDQDEKERAVFDASRVHLNHLVREVGLCLRYYAVTFRGGVPGRLILTGVNALEPRLDVMLASSSKMEVTLEDPRSPISPILDAIGHSDELGPAHGWLVAAGLALRGMRFGASPTGAEPARVGTSAGPSERRASA